MSNTSSGSIWSLYFICKGLVDKKVWIRFLLANLRASADLSISLCAALDREHIIGPSSVSEIFFTDSKSPLDAIAKPASIISTPRDWSVSAILSFSSKFIEQPGDCSPSLSVVSNINTFSSELLLVTLFFLYSIFISHRLL